jgi:RNA polymerase sigma-70 factor (ECF subfamily)
VYNIIGMGNLDKVFLRYYKNYKDKIFTYFFYRVNFNHTLAEDLTSEVFLKAFKHFASFEQTRSFQAWIYTIARNHLLNHYRTVYREIDLAQAEQAVSNFSSQLEANLELERVIQKIQTLDPYHRDVLLLRFVDGLDNGEIAAVLEKEEGAVRTQISRALRILKKLLE